MKTLLNEMMIFMYEIFYYNKQYYFIQLHGDYNKQALIVFIISLISILMSFFCYSE